MLGLYIQSDPVGVQGGLNTYSYVDGNSLQYIDTVIDYVGILFIFSPAFCL